jgi:hypothetical protein
VLKFFLTVRGIHGAHTQRNPNKMVDFLQRCSRYVVG